MTFPALVFSILLSTVYGTAFHLWKNGSLNRLIVFILLSWIGFWGGHIIGAALGWHFAALGPVNAGMATIGSAILLFLGEWLSRVEINRK